MVVSQPTLRLRRRRDGTWNLDGLLADPWPGPWIETPPITIQNATLELIPDEEPRSAGDAAETLEDVPHIGRADDSPFPAGGAEAGVSSPISRLARSGRRHCQSQPGDPPRRLARRSSRPEAALSTSSSRARPGETPSKE